MTVRAHLLHLDCRTKGGMQFGVLVLMVLWDALCGELFKVLVSVRAHSCDIDVRVLSGMQVTAQAHFCIYTVGCKGACSLGGGLGLRLGCWLIFARFTAGCRGGNCSIDGRVLLGAFFGGAFFGEVLFELVCKRCYLGSMLV